MKKKIIGVFLAIGAIVIIAIIVMSASGMINFGTEGKDKKKPKEMKTYIVDFEDEALDYTANLNDAYSPGDTAEIELDITEDNVNVIQIWITYQAVSPFGGVSIECTSPNSEVTYDVYDGEERYRTFNIAWYFCDINLPFDKTERYEVEATNQEEADILANQTYGYNKSIGIWTFKISFQTGCLRYSILDSNAEVSKYNIVLNKNIEDDSTAPEEESTFSRVNN